MKKRIRLLSSILILFIVSFGCSGSDDSSVSTDSGSSTETSFNFTLTSLKKQETASSTVGMQTSFTADQVMTGQLTGTP